MEGYGDRTRSYSEVVTLFKYEFPNRINPLSKNAVARITQRFNETLRVQNKLKTERSVSIDKEKSLDVVLYRKST